MPGEVSCHKHNGLSAAFSKDILYRKHRTEDHRVTFSEDIEIEIGEAATEDKSEEDRTDAPEEPHHRQGYVQYQHLHQAQHLHVSAETTHSKQEVSSVRMQT